jgi:hypothetical protein
MRLVMGIAGKVGAPRAASAEARQTGASTCAQSREGGEVEGPIPILNPLDTSTGWNEFKLALAIVACNVMAETPKPQPVTLQKGTRAAAAKAGGTLASST